MNTSTMNKVDGILVELPKYLGAACIGTTTHYGLLAFLVKPGGFDPVVASTCGAAVGATLIYLLHYYLIFRSGKKHREAAIRFYLVAGAGLLLNAAVLSTGINLLGWSLGPAQVLATLNQFWVGYTVNRRWTF